MQNVSVRLESETLEAVEEEAEARDMSRAAYLREIITTRHESDELESELDQLHTELDRIRRANRQILELKRENEQLVEYAENDVEWHEAALLTRLKWYVYGKD